MKITQTRKARRSTFGYLALILLLSAFAPQALNAASNDNFADAATLTGTNVKALGSNVNATNESGEPRPDSTDYTVWWTWTAPQDGYVTVNTFGTTFPTVVAVYQGSLVADLNQVDAEGQNLGTNLSQVQFPAKKGQVFKIQVGSLDDGATGAITLNLTEGTLATGGITNPVVYGAPTPFNDDFTGSSTLSGTNFTAIGFNESATTETNEPTFSDGGRTLWWTWTAPQNGYVTIDTQGTNFDNILAVYQGSFLTELNIVDYDSQGLGTNLSQVQFPVSKGQVFHIQMDSNSGIPGGTVILNLRETSLASVGITNSTIYGAPTPFNTFFANKAMVSGSSVTAFGFFDSATYEANEPPPHASSSDDSVLWWTWIAPSSGTVAINTIGTNFSNVLAVYQGTYLTELTSIVSASDNLGVYQSEVSLPVVSGQAYLIRVSSYIPNATETVILNLKLPPKTGPKAQTISFPPIDPKTFSTTRQTFGLNGTASSGLPVSFSIGTYPISLSGTNVSLTDNFTIKATQAGNSTYAPATPITRTIRLQ